MNANRNQEREKKFRENYFEVIDTKEKVYWLGFLYADGWITKQGKNRKSKRVGIWLGKKEEIIIDRFIKLKLNKQMKKKYSKDGKGVYVAFGNKKIINDLENLGLHTNKSNSIELPKLKGNELYLAFVLGYYDGDGTVNTTKICSGSRVFLEQIKEKFNLKSKIIKHNYESEINGRVINSKANYMHLRAKLFNEMMDNYNDSLPRKRRRFSTPEEKAAEASKKFDGRKKFFLTKPELEKLIWEKPAVQIAKELGVSDRLITKKCRQWGIKKPDRVYWAKKRAKKQKVIW